MWWTDPPEVAPRVVAQVALQFDVLVWSLVVVGLIGLGIYAWLEVRRRYLGPDDEPDEADDPLEHYRRLVEAGELDPQEFERIRSRLQTQDHPATPPTPPAPTSPTDPPQDPPETPPTQPA